MATRGSVTVNLDATSTVSVYASVDSVYRLVGKYENISGSQLLEFDMPKGTEDLLVNTHNKSIETKVGNTVDFSSLGVTRAISKYDSQGIKVEEAGDDNDWIFTTNLLNSVRKVLPENQDNRDNNGVTKDFYFTSDGKPFVIYPFYWETGNTLQFGIYYLDDNKNIVRVPIYQTNDTINDQARLFYKDKDEWVHAVNTEASYKKNGHTSSTNSRYYTGDYKSRGIKVTLPNGLKYGMYIYNMVDQVYLYSESSHNGDPYRVKGNYSQTVSGKYACYGAIYKSGEYTFLSFEDWKGANQAGGFDLNDLIVMITPDPTYHNAEEEEKNLTWTVACEDLGDTGDIDFNDIVFSVSHVSGADKAYVTPLAAGGTLKAEIFHNNTSLGEIHELFGATGTDGKYPTINVTSKTATAEQIPVSVGKDFSMTQNMGGFSIKVSDTNSAVTISAPPSGGCPQMFVVTGSWAWPKEGVHIEQVYSKFKGWSNSQKKNLYWYETYDESKVVKP